MIEALKERQNQVLAQVRKQLANMPPPDLQAVNPSQEAIEREEKRQALVKILAEIEKRINEENARPKKRYISPATREEVYAIYYDDLRRKIEDRGTTNFPEAAGRKLYGSLTMVITVNHTGAVLGTEILQSSGNKTLDRRAQAIVRGLEFGRFSEAMRRRADQIVVVSRFRFTREAGCKPRCPRSDDHPPRRLRRHPLGGGQHLRPGGAGSAVFLAGTSAVPQPFFCLSFS
jgi:periplasmic protein TonB